MERLLQIVHKVGQVVAKNNSSGELKLVLELVIEFDENFSQDRKDTNKVLQDLVRDFFRVSGTPTPGLAHQ